MHSPLHFSLVWYGKYKNRGFISPLTLKKLEGMPFVEERWKDLANQLGSLEKTTDNCEERLILIKIVYQYSFRLQLRHAWVMENGMGIWKDCVKDTSDRSRLREILANVEY